MAMHGSQSSTSYGKAIIDNTSGEQIWRFRILKYESHSSWFIQIGIVKDDDKWLSKHCNIHVSTEWCRRTKQALNPLLSAEMKSSCG